MKFNLKSYAASATAIIALSASALAVVPASAQTAVATGLDVQATAVTSGGATVNVHTNANAGVNVAGNVTATTRAQDRADQEIDRRTSALGALSARISGVANISSSDKASLSASIQSQLQTLADLKAKIAADIAANATSSLKTDVASITASYRIFALVIPQGAIAAASDRGTTIVDMMQTLGGKLQARISAAQASGTDVTAMTTTYADFTAKIADAQTNLQASLSETANLKPDNGDKTVMASNTAALKDARAKIKAANQDFVTARADAQSIMKALAKLDVSASATTSASAY